MKYKIYPPVGIARLGGHDQFFIGPEIPGVGPKEIQTDDSETAVTTFKDASKKNIKKQGIRFHLFESDDGETYRPANLPGGTVVTWKVTLANKKSAVVRPANPPITPQRPQLQNNSQGLLIDGGTKTISGTKTTSEKFVGRFQSIGPDGQPYSVDVELGQLRTDAKGRLIVLAGKGFSSAAPHTPLGASYYRNPGWHDDVSDGPVTADIRLPDGTHAQAENGAWVIVAPPDYAPGINCIVTLFDIIRQVGIDHHHLQDPAEVKFDRDIAPMIERTRRLRWVHDNTNWSNEKLVSSDLRNTDQAFAALRRDVRKIILNTEGILQGHTDPSGPPWRLRQWQKTVLQRWVDGDFDGTVLGADANVTADGLTRAALDGAAGQGFCPGIEAGIIVLDPTLYLEPFDFRINHNGLEAGDLTALMAQPWQADFLKCDTVWWPSQRPDLAPQTNGTFKPWVRGVQDHSGMVRDGSRLGFVVEQNGNEVFFESDRDVSLPGA